MNIFLFIAGIYITTFLLGKIFEKIRVPWIFAALIIGAGLAVYNPFKTITSAEAFELFGEIGMYFLLFLVGFELNVKKLKERSSFIFKSAFFIIFLEGLFGSLMVHYVFGYEWFVSVLVALSFATVGEAILVPILQEFKLVNTKLGQSIIGIGAADDLIEVLLLLVASVLVGARAEANPLFILISLGALVFLTFSFQFFSKNSRKFTFVSIETLFLFILFVFFLFIGVGSSGAAAPLAAILAGMSIRIFVPKERLVFVESEIKSLTYGFFAPLFFVWVGLGLNVGYLISAPLLILLVVAVSSLAKLLGSYIIGRKELGTKNSLLLGIGLSVRFSTGIIIIKILLDNNIIGLGVYSVIIASSIIFAFLIPFLFSQLVVRWKKIIT